MKKVLVAMSGGVDSSVTAYLLQRQGYECTGVTMKLYSGDMAGLPGESSSCCSLEDVEDARSVCYRLDIPHYVFNFSDSFEEKVIRKFAASYRAGLTPNPCIDCNRYLKFGALYRRAKELECDYIATGHYARIEQAADGRFLLKKAADLSKDQSYFLHVLTQEQLAHTLFPLGGMTKSQVREIAEEQGFLNARKRDSQDICFVPDGDYLSFLERYTGEKSQPGNLIDLEGRVLGQHRGAMGYTIGQRRGLGLAMPEPVYVCGKNMEQNTVTVGPESALFSRCFAAGDWNWIIQPPEDGLAIEAEVKIRYSQTEHRAILQRDGERVKVEFDQPQRAISPGQAAVAYQGDTVLGGGTIYG